MSENQIRYSVITEKNPREILMLRGSGCKWKRCTFCDYHLDASPDADENYIINSKEIAKVTGQYGKLEVINSGSIFELDQKTMQAIKDCCMEKKIHEIHFETHWMYRHKTADLRREFAKISVTVKFKIGVETFDEVYRETKMIKGMPQATPEEIATYCDEVCLLFGLEGQTYESMKTDMETGLKYFERVCVNIMVPNTTAVQPDENVIQTFVERLYPDYCENSRMDILLVNTDFGVGGEKNA